MTVSHTNLKRHIAQAGNGSLGDMRTALDAMADGDDLYVGGVAVTSTAAELNILDTVTATAAELNYLDIATLGTGAASKAVVLDAGDDYTWPAAGVLTYGVLKDPAGTTLTSTAAELNYLDIAALGTGAASKAVVLDANGDYTFPATATIVMPASGTAEFAASSTLTLSGAVVQAPVFIADATPYTVLAANSGKMHVILEQASSITINLPVIAAGLSYKFIMGGVATEAQNWIFVATTPSFWNGGVAWTDLDDLESNLAVVYGNGTSHLTLTVVTPAAGTCLEVYSNGTEWFVHGAVISNTTPAFT